MDDFKKPSNKAPYRHEPSLDVRPEPRSRSVTDSAEVERMVNVPKSEKHGLLQRLRQFPGNIKDYWQSASRRKKIITVSVLCGILVGGGIGAYFLQPQPEEPEPAPIVVEPEEELPPEPTTLPSPLTGVEVEPELAELPVTAVIIENSPDARPQSGLYDAGVVFEAMVEGSITRFLALYQEHDPEQIGPIRSLRRNHIDWLVGFDAAVAHVGGSAIARRQAASQDVKSLNQFNHPEAYHRTNTRFAPHNMYSSRENLLKIHDKLGYSSSDFNSFVRKTAEPAGVPEITEVSVDISGPMYNVRFEYEEDTNSYLRFMGGRTHVDEQSGKQINPDVVVVMVAGYSRDGIYSVYDAIGSNTAYIFQDGKLTKGTWEKPSRSENIRFVDEDGSPIGLNPGQTWITLATNENQISVKP
jgi:hypothetical protein